ncbi:hypothetical protein ZWY2020_047730 [Hordeum vulgare]|nr:hypothetical protein ZWY2020_047730 [Hordeum vulgare]
MVELRCRWLGLRPDRAGSAWRHRPWRVARNGSRGGGQERTAEGRRKPAGGDRSSGDQLIFYDNNGFHIVNPFSGAKLFNTGRRYLKLESTWVFPPRFLVPASDVLTDMGVVGA